MVGNSNDTFSQPKAHESSLHDKITNHEPRALIFKGMGYKRTSVEIDGAFYESISCAKRATGHDRRAIKKRCLSDKFSNYKIVPFRVNYTEKRCVKCKKVYPLSEFYINKPSKDGLRSQCKVCDLRGGREHYAKTYIKKRQIKYSDYEVGTKEYNRNIALLCMYNISLKEYNDLLHQQNYKCKICGIPQKELDKNLCVDHDHETGEIRGLLCRCCNSGLGHFRDNTQTLQNAIEYLKTNLSKSNRSPSQQGV